MSSYGGYESVMYRSIEVFSDHLWTAPRNQLDTAVADYVKALNAITAKRTVDDRIQHERALREIDRKKRQEERALDNFVARIIDGEKAKGRKRKRKPYKRRTYTKAA
ncbi:hypothetical protein [Nocardia otitidiscaviarum]|uniref:hypothetical protein n=1 Tax=Nocardia otitidiscaviarum TaxID=1823 RepID=UPI002456C848|nr:hypothetical protein [Nocardia otitidiscaviarum]